MDLNEPGWEMQQQLEERQILEGSFAEYWAMREKDMRDQRAFWKAWEKRGEKK